MDFSYWRERFEASRTERPIRPICPILPTESHLSPERRKAVARLFVEYARGEAAEQAVADRLLAGAKDSEDRIAWTMLLQDERRHGEILIEAANVLDPTSRPSVGRDHLRGIAVFRVLGFFEALVVFHMLEICVSTAYRILRVANRDTRW